MIGYPKSLLLTEFLTEFDMFSFKKRKSQPSDESTNKDSKDINDQKIPKQANETSEIPAPEKKSLFGRLKSGLAKTRASLKIGRAHV